MKSGTRKVLSIVPLGLQFVAMASAISIISFIVPATRHVIEEAEGKIPIPTPSRLLIENASFAKLILIGLFAVSFITYVWSRKKMKEEADQFAVQGTVYSVVWYLSITILGGMVMAGLLPYFALHSSTQ